MKTPIELWLNVSRAYEIALLGNFTMQIVFDKDYKQGFDDYETVKSFYNDVKFVKDGDLISELYKPDYRGKAFKTKADIHETVNVARKNPVPTKFKNSSCDTYLNVATDRLGLSLNQYNKIVEISKIIAQLEGDNLIAVEHVAEAIQLVCRWDENMCNAESKSIKFGSGIEIALHELNSTDVENAIEYLTKLIKK